MVVQEEDVELMLAPEPPTPLPITIHVVRGGLEGWLGRALIDFTAESGGISACEVSRLALRAQPGKPRQPTSNAVTVNRQHLILQTTEHLEIDLKNRSLARTRIPTCSTLLPRNYTLALPQS